MYPQPGSLDRRNWGELRPEVGAEPLESTVLPGEPFALQQAVASVQAPQAEWSLLDDRQVVALERRPAVVLKERPVLEGRPLRLR